MSTDRGVLTSITKRCARCNEEKTVAEFYPRRSLDGRPFSYCKSCVHDVTRDRRVHRQDRLVTAGRRMAQELVASGEPIDFGSLPRAARTRIIELLDVPGRSASDVAARAGCSVGTVYRHRRDRVIAQYDAK